MYIFKKKFEEIEAFSLQAQQQEQQLGSQRRHQHQLNSNSKEAGDS